MMKNHRGVTFDVHQATNEKWEWVVYPKIGQGTRTRGVGPTEADATKLAQAHIDDCLDGKEAANSSPQTF